MIKFLDYFFLKWYHIAFYLRKDMDGAKHSAFLFLCFYFFLCITSLLNLLGRVISNPLKIYLTTTNKYYFVGIGIIILIILHFSYYRKINTTQIIISYKALKYSNRLVIDIFIYFLFVAIPLFFFLLFKEYI